MAPSPSTSQPPGGGARHLAFLDVVRGVAILLVVGFHTLDAGLGIDHLQWNGWWLDFAHAPWTFVLLLPVSFGWIGVAIFFAVSGFCIHLSYERSPGREWKAFFLRRFFRIYPPYLLALCFFAFAFPPTRLGGWTLDHLVQFGSHFLLVHNVDNRWVVGVNGSFWSIAVEVQLYLLYPLLYLAARRLGWTRALLLAGGMEVGLRLGDFWFGVPCWLGASPFNYWLSWAVGAKLADDYLQGRPLLLARWPLAPFVALTAGSFFIRPLAEFSFLLTALTTVRAIAGCLARPDVPAQPSWLAKWVGWVGGFSYSLYLIHQPFLKALSPWLKGMFPGHVLHPMLLFFCGLASCCLIFPAAWLFCRGVELKSVEWGKRFVQRRSRAKTSVPTAYAG
ncbi:MAG: acyltransferase [Verrucomicrobiota bacterium]